MTVSEADSARKGATGDCGNASFCRSSAVAANPRNQKVRWRALAEEFSSCRDAATVGARCRLRLTWMSSRVHALCPALSTTRCVEVSAIVGGRPLRVPIRWASDDWHAFVRCSTIGINDVPLQPRTILDLGANVGFASLYFAACWPSAHLAAVTECDVRQMRRVFERNGVAAHIVEGAAGVEQGRATLYLRGSTCHSLLPEHEFPYRGKLDVRTWSIPELLSEVGWDTVDLLKLDLEGYERLLLRRENGWLSRVGAIIGELHGSDAVADIEPWLQPFGFHVSKIVKRRSRLFLAMRPAWGRATHGVG